MPRGEVYLRTERLIGEQAQVDWAHVGSLAVTGGMRPLWVFVMVLAYSRAMWAELVFDLTAATCVVALVDRFTQHCHALDIDIDSWRQRSETLPEATLTTARSKNSRASVKNNPKVRR